MGSLVYVEVKIKKAKKETTLLFTVHSVGGPPCLNLWYTPVILPEWDKWYIQAVLWSHS